MTATTTPAEAPADAPSDRTGPVERSLRLPDARSRPTVKDSLYALAFLAPSLVVFAVFIFYPLAKTVSLGFYRSDPFGLRSVYVGTQQYVDVLKSADFHNSLRVTVLFSLLTVPTGLALGLGLALLANQRLRGIGVFRTIFSSTIATSVAVASAMFLALLNPSVGLINPFLRAVHVIGHNETLQVFSNARWALVAVAVATVWQNLGLSFIVNLAGLQAIPDDLYESAAIDGARRWSRFKDITLPMLSPTLLFNLVVLTIGAFESFGQIDLLTQGGPLGKTNVIVYSIYQTAFGRSQDQNAAAAQAVVLFVLVLVLTLVQFTLLERRVFYGRD